MNNFLRLCVRIFITACTAVLIYFSVDVILKIKYNDKLNNEKNEDWNWEKENKNNWYLLNDKYINVDNDKAPIAMMQNMKIQPKKEDEKRILVVGDSFVFGTGTNNINYTWWKQLDLRIKEAGYSNVSVYGVGKYGYSTKDQLDYYLRDSELIKSIDPDLIILGYVSNDPEVRDKNGILTVDDIAVLDKEKNKIYQKSPTLYYELIDRMNALSESEYEKIIEIGETLGGHRWDALMLYLVKGERLNAYKRVLKSLKGTMDEIGIPYFVAVTNNIDNTIVGRAVDIAVSEMNNLSIDTYHPKYDSSKLLADMNLEDYRSLYTNPIDGHPGIVWTYDYSKKIFQKIKNDYGFIFEDAIIKDINELELNINDTTPYLEVKKIDDNIFEFEYPKTTPKEEGKYKFLYYPIEKDYIKLNLEYPKNVSKIILKSSGLKNAEVYVNVEDYEYGFDIDDANRKVTTCDSDDYITWNVNKKITSVNIVAEFERGANRKIQIEFVEK